MRQTGGRGQYGHVVIDMEPNEPGAGYEFENRIVGGTIPREYIPAVDEGIQEAMSTGVLAGYPVVDIKVALIDGSYHEVDSSDMAFKIAGSLAFKNAAQKAKPVLLEPMMAVEVVTPAEYMGDVMGDLNSRRGHIDGMEPRGNAQVITRHGAALDDVRLRHRRALRHAGSRHVHDAVQALRGGACLHRQRDRRQGARCREPRASRAQSAVAPVGGGSCILPTFGAAGRRTAFCVTSTSGFREKE